MKQLYAKTKTKSETVKRGSCVHVSDIPETNSYKTRAPVTQTSSDAFPILPLITKTEPAHLSSVRAA